MCAICQPTKKQLKGLHMCKIHDNHQSLTKLTAKKPVDVRDEL